MILSNFLSVVSLGRFNYYPNFIVRKLPRRVYIINFDFFSASNHRVTCKNNETELPSGSRSERIAIPVSGKIDMQT